MKQLCRFSSIALMVLFLWGALCSLSTHWEAQSAVVRPARQTQEASRPLQPQIRALPRKSRYARSVLVMAEMSTPLLRNEAPTTKGLAAFGRRVRRVNAHALPDNSHSDIATFTRWPANIAACLFAGLVLFLFFWQQYRARRMNPPGPATSTSPGDLTPAQAGALARGRVSGVLMQATLLHMACLGTLAIEVLGKDELVIHLRNPKETRQGIEHQMWKLLSSVEAQYYAVTPPALKRNRQAWVQMQLALRQELMRSGWFDPHSFRWKGFRFLGGCVGLWLAFLDYGNAVVFQEFWGLLGSSLFLGTAVLLFIWAYMQAETTRHGEHLAAEWRAYRAGLDAACEQFGSAAQMEQALPYALALGAKRFLARYAHLAAAAGYRPGWLRYSQHAAVEQGELDGWQVFLRTLRLPSLGLMPIVAPVNRHAR